MQFFRWVNKVIFNLKSQFFQTVKSMHTQKYFEPNFVIIILNYSELFQDNLCSFQDIKMIPKFFFEIPGLGSKPPLWIHFYCMGHQICQTHQTLSAYTSWCSEVPDCWQGHQTLCEAFHCNQKKVHQSKATSIEALHQPIFPALYCDWNLQPVPHFRFGGGWRLPKRDIYHWINYL